MRSGNQLQAFCSFLAARELATGAAESEPSQPTAILGGNQNTAQQQKAQFKLEPGKIGNVKKLHDICFLICNLTAKNTK